MHAKDSRESFSSQSALSIRYCAAVDNTIPDSLARKLHDITELESEGLHELANSTGSIYKWECVHAGMIPWWARRVQPSLAGRSSALPSPGPLCAIPGRAHLRFHFIGRHSHEGFITHCRAPPDRNHGLFSECRGPCPQGKAFIDMDAGPKFGPVPSRAWRAGLAGSLRLNKSLLRISPTATACSCRCHLCERSST